MSETQATSSFPRAKDDSDIPAHSDSHALPPFINRTFITEVTIVWGSHYILMCLQCKKTFKSAILHSSTKNVVLSKYMYSRLNGRDHFALIP